MKKVIIWLITIAIVTSLAMLGISCKAEAPAEEEVAPVEEAQEEEAVEEEAEAVEEEVMEEPAVEPPVVGISTGSSGTVWRDKMITDFEQVGDELKAAGAIADYKIVNNVTNGDATEQANIIRDFISEGVDIIMINPNSADALNGVIAEATDAGILCVVYDSQVTAPGILNVTNNHYEWIKPLARATFDLLGGEGKVVNISGLEGHPANTNFDRGVYDVVDEYNGSIEIVAEYFSGWNETGSKEGAVQVLASGIEIDGWFQAGSMGIGALTACIEADRIPKAMTGNPDAGWYKLWKQMRDDPDIDFKSVAKPNPPGIGAAALRLAVSVNQGKEFMDGVLANLEDDNPTYYLPVEVLLTEENFDEYWEEVKDQPDDYVIDYLMPQDAVDALFK